MTRLSDYVHNISTNASLATQLMLENGDLLGGACNSPTDITDLNDTPIGWSHFPDNTTLANRPVSNNSSCFVQTIEAEREDGLQIYFDISSGGQKIYFRRFNINSTTRDRTDFMPWTPVNPDPQPVTPDLPPVNRDMLITETGLVQIEGTPRLITIEASGGGGGAGGAGGINYGDGDTGGDTIVKSGSDTGPTLITAKGAVGGVVVNGGGQNYLKPYIASTAPAGGRVLTQGGAIGGDSFTVPDRYFAIGQTTSAGDAADLVILDITANFPSALHFTIGVGGDAGDEDYYSRDGQAGFARLKINY